MCVCVHFAALRAHAECSKSTSSETDLNDNLPSHRTPTSASSSAKYASHNGFFPQHTGPASASSIYDSPPSRGASVSTDSGLYHLPRSYSQDTVLLPKSASSPPAHQDGGDGASEIYVFNTPTRKASMETQLRNLSVSYDIPPTPGGANSTYQVPRTSSSSTGLAGPDGGGDVVPPPRPPKPLLSSSSGLPPPPPAERSPTDTYCVPRSASETDGNYCVPTSAGNKALRSNTIGTVDSSRLRKGLCSRDLFAPFKLKGNRANQLLFWFFTFIENSISHGSIMMLGYFHIESPPDGDLCTSSTFVMNRAFINSCKPKCIISIPCAVQLQLVTKADRLPWN